MEQQEAMAEVEEEAGAHLIIQMEVLVAAALVALD